jgi:hypothetical protein
MEELDIMQLWQAQNQRLDQTIQLNQKLLRETMGMKAQSAMRSLKASKIAGIVAFLIYLAILANLIVYALNFAITTQSSAANYFIVSISAIFLINLKGISDYIRHLVWLHKVDYDGSITQIQKQLMELQISIMKHSRWMLLQLPFWTTFTLSDTWFPQNVRSYGIVIQCLVTALFTFGAIWLYLQHKPENLNKKWMQKLLSISGNKAILKAMRFYEEIDAFSAE